MPEGPSIIILKERMQEFQGKKVLTADGYAKVDFSRFKNQTIREFKTWGKHFLICFPKFTVRLHLMLFGSYTVNEDKKYNPKFSLHLKNDTLNFYLCQVKIIEEDLDKIYDWRSDIMSASWSIALAKKKLKEIPGEFICDALGDQEIFSGSGNIIKNEVLHRSKVHPESIVGKIPAAALSLVLKEVRKYSRDFLKWRKLNVLSRHWEAYDQKECFRCALPIIKKLTGKNKRQSYFCSNCQEKYK